MLQLYGSSIVADQNSSCPTTTGAWKIPSPKKGMKSIYFKYFIILLLYILLYIILSIILLLYFIVIICNLKLLLFKSMPQYRNLADVVRLRCCKQNFYSDLCNLQSVKRYEHLLRYLQLTRHLKS